MLNRFPIRNATVESSQESAMTPVSGRMIEINPANAKVPLGMRGEGEQNCSSSDANSQKLNCSWVRSNQPISPRLISRTDELIAAPFK